LNKVLTGQVNLFGICSIFKDEKEPKNLFLKEDFASHRSLIRWINYGINKEIICPLNPGLIQVYGDLNLPLG